MYVIFEWFHVAFLMLIQKSEEKLKKKNSLEKDDKARKVTYDIPLRAMYSVHLLFSISLHFCDNCSWLMYMCLQTKKQKLKYVFALPIDFFCLIFYINNIKSVLYFG